MLLRLVPRSFGRVMQQANRIYLKMSMVFLQSLHPHLSHDPFPSLRSLDLSSRVTLFRAPRPTSKQKQRRARCYGWEGSFNLQGGEEDVATLTTCDLPSRSDAIHLNKQGWTSNNLSLFNKIRWSTRSKPFLKSAKNRN